VARAAPRALTRKVAPGETAESLAKRFYGQPFAARVLLLANGLRGLDKRPPALKVGSTIRLPTAWSYRIRTGDTFADLARDYLGDAHKAGFLAWINGKDPRQAAPAGHVIIVPALVAVKVPRRLSLTKLAARLLEQDPRSEAVTRLVRRIRQYNGVKGRLGRRRRVVVPLIRLRVLGWFLASRLPAGDPGTERRARRRLARAELDLRAGRYLEIALGLAPVVRRTGLSRALLSRAHHLRCTAFVALRHGDLALAAARAVLRLDPGYKLDPVLVSPKVRAVFRRAATAGGKTGRTGMPGPGRSGN
jgi:hypothetical protein